MPDYSAGTAVVRIRPTTQDFVRDLNAQLKRVRDPGFVISVAADTGQAGADIRRFREVESRSGLNLGVTADLGKAQADMAAFRAHQRADGVAVKVDVDTGAAMAKIAAMKTAASGGRGGGGLVVPVLANAGALTIGSLPAMATALATVAAALQQVSQAGLALPGLMAGLGASFGTAAIGFSGMKDALEAVNEAADGTPESMQKAQDALKDLAPSAAAVITTLSEMTPLFENLKRTVQGNMFDGVAGQLKTLADKEMPRVTAGLGDIGTAWNSNITALMTSVGTERNMGLLDRILGNTADAQTRFSGAIDPLVHGIGTLTAAGTDVLPRLADAMGSLGTRFDTFITAADQDGRLDEWINDGLTGMSNLGETVLNIGKSFTAITEAAGGGGSFLQWLETASGKLETFLNSADGQDKLQKFFDEGREQLAQWAPILQNAADLFGDVYNASKRWTDALLPALETVSGILADQPELIEGIVTAFLAWKTITGVSSLVTSLTGLQTLLGTGLPAAASKGAGGISAALGRVAVPAWLAYLVGEQNPAINVPIPTTTTTNSDGTTTTRIIPPVDEDGTPSHGLLIDPPSTTVPSSPRGADTSGMPVIPPPAAAPPGASESPLLDILGRRPPGYATGGPTPRGRGNGPTGGFISELHGDEWVIPAQARRAIGDKTLAALTAGRSFSVGGGIDENGNPITPGMLPGPVSAPATMSIAPNPTAAGTGGLGSIVSQFVSGLAAGPAANALALGQAGMNMAMPGVSGSGVDPNTTVHGTGAGLLPGLNVPAIPGLTQMGTPAGDIATRGAGIGGFAGLFSSLASPDPAGALMDWGGQTSNWLADWGMKTLGSVGSTLWDGALGFFGLENSILSSSNPYNQAAQQTGQFFMGQGGPFGELLGAGQTAAGATGKAPEKMTQEELLEYLAAQNGTLPPGMKLPKGVGSEKGLQINTIKTKRAVSAMFPSIAEIGGVRKDALKWHPNGLAIDVMIPGQGGNNDPTTPEGLALGNQIFAFVKANASALGVDMGATLWQTKDHYNHIHIATTGGGYADRNTEFSMPGVPAMAKGGPTPNVMGPLDAKGGHLAVVHPKEFMISARGRASVPDSFLHALNSGMVDPKALPGYFPGGAIRPLAAAARPTPSRPPVTPARTMQPRVVPTAPAQPAAPTPAPTPAPAAPPAPAPPQSIAASGSPAQSIIAANQGAGGINHNVDWMNTLIQSSASNIGQLASTAMSVASMGGAGIPGMGAVGAAGPFVAGGIQQVGKIAEGVVNVVSSALVGSVPGSFGGKAGESPYGRVIKTPIEAPPPSGQGGGRNYTFNGISDINRLMDRIELNDKMETQATLAKYS